MVTLTSITLRSLIEKPGRHSDGGGLHFKVLPGHKAYFTYRYSVGGRTSEMSLGPYSELSLAEARVKHIAARWAKGQSLRQIGAALGLTPGAVVGLVNRARKHGDDRFRPRLKARSRHPSSARSSQPARRWATAGHCLRRLYRCGRRPSPGC